MMNAATPSPLLSVDEYLALERESSVRHEYVGGEIYAHAGASERHNIIALNVAASLRVAARGTPCHVFMSDMNLRVAEDVLYYPDVMVVCDETDADPYVKHRPCVVVEVLSPSTEKIDLREKLLAYRRLDSLRAYIMVHQDRRRVLSHLRDENGAWWPRDVAGDGNVSFPCPESVLTLDDIYEGVTF
jgi:Uma2 family endonuclease